MTAISPQDPQRRRELAAIHTAKKQLGLDDDAYRDLLAGVTGKRSAAELDGAGRQRVIERFRQIGFAAKHAPSPRDRNFVYHARPEHRFIAALWKSAALLCVVDDPAPSALDRFVERQSGIRALKWLPPEKIAGVVEALRSMCARAGFDVPFDTRGEKKGLAVREQLVRAIWRRLEEAGALAFKDDSHRANALDAYFDGRVSPCKKGVDHPMTTAAELDRCAEKLGAWLRAARAKQREPSGDPAPPAGSPVSADKSARTPGAP